MHYTIPDDRPFVTQKELKRTSKVPTISIAIRDFMRTHNVDVKMDPVTKKYRTVVTDKNQEQSAIVIYS